MKNDNELKTKGLMQLNDSELRTLNGGSQLAYWVFWVIGNMADTPNRVGNPLILFG